MRLEDALTAQQNGADAVGFIFYENSKRYVDPQMVKSITLQLNPFINKVGVFVNESAANINAISKIAGLTNIQLHGEESIELAQMIDLPVIKVFNMDDSLTENLKIWQEFSVMIDSRDVQMRGGTGKILPWQLLKDIVFDKPIILAGGLNPTNVQEAIRILNPVAVDVSSGVEKSPGVKDRNLIRQFIKNVNN